MDFSTMKQEVGAQLGLDYSNNAYDTLISRWINTAQQEIFAAFDWPFLRGSTPVVIQTVTDYTTGTCTVAAAGTTVTFSATITNSKANQYIRFASSDDWYLITAHTAATATATISPAAISVNTAAAYTIRKFYYSTTSVVDKIIQIKQSITPYQLAEVGKEFFEEIEPDAQSTGTPRVYRMAGYDVSGYPQFQLWPTPDSVLNLYVDYYRTATDLVTDDDISIIPAKWHTNVLLQAALAQGYQWDNDTRSVEAMAKFMAGIESMKGHYSISTFRHRVSRAIDEQPGGQGPIPFPDNYPATWPR